MKTSPKHYFPPTILISDYDNTSKNMCKNVHGVKIKVEETDEICTTVPITQQQTSLSTESIADKLQQLCSTFESQAGTLNGKQLNKINASIDTALSSILHEGESNLINLENQEPVNKNTKNQIIKAPEEQRLNNKCTLQNSEFDHSYAKLFLNYTVEARVSNLRQAFQTDQSV